MCRKFLLIAIILAIPFSGIWSAQEPNLVTPQPEHELLKRFAGDWDFERLTAPVDGSKPQVVGQGVVSAELVGEFFVIGRWSGEVYGTEYEAFQSIGYDIQKNQYTGSWADSIISYRWKLHGTVDDESQELILMTSGPGPTGGTASFRERYQFESDHSIKIIGQMLQGEQWGTITTSRLTRRTTH